MSSLREIDVAVVGGGLTGCYAALQLARKGLQVVVLEEHPQVGKPWFCTGIVGKQGFDDLGLPGQLIQRELGSACFISPGGKQLHVARPQTQAYILNRSALDGYLAEQAFRAGARIMVSHRCTDVQIHEDHVDIRSVAEGKKDRSFRARVCLLATGVGYAIHQRLGLDRPARFLDSAQVEVDGKDFHEVEIYLGSQVAPGSFAWSVPVGPGRVRIGVTARAHAARYLKNLLTWDRIRDRIRVEEAGIARRAIPMAAVGNSVAPRLMILGDAAGQVKPTTGGGIYYGMLCAQIAADVTWSAFERGVFSRTQFEDYEVGWRKKIGLEISIGMAARNILTGCADHQIDALIARANGKRVARLITKYADFDWHQKLIVNLSKAPFLLKQVSNLY